MSDLIDEWKRDFKGYIDELDIPRDDYNGIMEYIDEVPSAQPEITHCRDCVKLQTDNIFHDYWCDGKRVRPDHYCGYAKRWEE